MTAAVAALTLATTAQAGDRSDVAQNLNRGLRGTPMHGTGYVLEAAGHKWKISPYFMAAVAGTESSFGAAACANNRYNVWGLASCGYGWHVPDFRSWKEAIYFYARFLATRWRGHSSPWSFRGYAACTDCWARKTAWWMRSRFGAGSETRYR